MTSTASIAQRIGKGFCSDDLATKEFVRQQQILPRSFPARVPAKVVRPVTDDELRWKTEGTATYQQLAVRSARTMRPADPLPAPEPDRRRLELPGFEPLYAAREKFGR